MARSIDISSEMAEGFALPPFGLDRAVIEAIVVPGTGEHFHYRHGLPRFDDAVLPYISSASLACGLHSGDPLTLQRALPALLERGVRVGAHPSYPDVFRFGQRRIELAANELQAVVLYQLGALAGVLAGHNERIQHLKAHGALQFDLSYDERVATVVADAVQAFDPHIVIVLMAGAPCVNVLRRCGARVAEEAFVDRGYEASGRIVSRDHPRALIADPAEAAERMLRMVLEDVGTSVDGECFPLRADTFCMHSDTPNAGAIMAAVDAALHEHGVERRPLAEIL